MVYYYRVSSMKVQSENVYFLPIFIFIDMHQQFHHNFVSFIQLNVKTLSLNNMLVILKQPEGNDLNQ